MSRTVVAHQFHSLDGVVESPNLWQFDAFGAQEGQLMGSVLGAVSDVIIGRVLWQEWSQFWPGSDDPFAQFMNPVRKHVITSTLTGELPWNSTVVASDPIDYVRQLKESGSGDISVVGGIETIRTLFLGGVIDRLILTTHPVLAGSGRRLFDGATPTTRLVLESASATDAGNVIMTYGLRS